MYPDHRFCEGGCDRHRLLVRDRSGTAVLEREPCLEAFATWRHNPVGGMIHGSLTSAVLLYALDNSRHQRLLRGIRTGGMEV
jgi:hypothetical protein